MLGVPGLAQAARSGNVAIANALGSGLAESPAYAAFLPGLCRLLLGEELKIPTVATWWCGQREPLAYVTDHLNELVVKPTFPGRRGEPIFGANLSQQERQALLDRMRKSPSHYVAQEHVALSTVPVWTDGKLHPRHMVLRVYAVPSGNGYAVLPGGLTRVSASLENMVVSIQSGGGSKDTWVLGDGPEPAFTLLRPAAHPLDVSRATFDLPSRLADNLFWLGRYTERLEAAVRIARSVLARSFQEGDSARFAGLNAGVDILLALGYLGTERPPALEQEVLSMIYDPGAANGLVWSIHQVRRVAWLLRDRISVDAWLILNQLDQQFSNPPASDAFRISSAQDRLDQAVITLSAFGGLVMESMTRGDGWRFLDIGRRLERAIQMAELLRNSLVPESLGNAGVLEAILEMADSSITYRSRYLTSLQSELVLDLLLVDEFNPRSIAFQLARLAEHMRELPGAKTAVRRTPEERLTLSMQMTVQLADVRELARAEGAGSTEALDDLLGRLATDLSSLSDTLTRTYFSHAMPARRL